jgi:hypothetical protein
MANPPTSQIWGAKKMLHLAVNVFLAPFFKPGKYDFILYKGLFMKNMDQIRSTLRGKNPYSQSS